MGLLEGKSALITGAARGIGKAIALRFASEGADIAFTDITDGSETLSELLEKGIKAKFYLSNASDFAQTHEVVEKVCADFNAVLKN